jgi:mono/diheme cytochrome c family protein
MRIRYRRTKAFAAALLSFGVLGAFVAADSAVSQETKQSEQQFQQLIRSVAGPDLFRAYCASCHSSDAKGHGPAAGALKGEVPDLTALARHNKGVFPAARVRAAILGDDVIAAHGSRDMPVWGPIFHQIEDDVDRGNVRLENLVKYLESIQSVSATSTPDKHVDKAPIANSTSPSGAVLYKRHCAACHGNDLKGNGPAPPPFKEWTPDLTTLATRHGGKFPDTFFTNVLRSGVKLPAHGPAEMPIWGTTFTESEHLNENQITLRIAELASYVKSLQAK